MAVRRKGVESSEVRAQLIEAAAQILREEGGAAITARRIAEKVGLKRQIVHYYFGTIEELILAMIQREAAAAERRYEAVMQSEEPLRMLAQIGIDGSARSYEITALAFRFSAVRAEFVRSLETFRRQHADALARHLEQRGVQSNVSTVVATTVMLALSQVMSAEAALGVSEGHREINAFLESWLTAFAQRGVSPQIPD